MDGGWFLISRLISRCLSCDVICGFVFVCLSSLGDCVMSISC